MYLEIIVESIIFYFSLAGIFFYLKSKPKERKYGLMCTLLFFFLIWALLNIVNNREYVVSLQHIILELAKLSFVIYLYFLSFGIYRKKLENDREQRLQLLTPINQTEIRKIVNECKYENEKIKEKAASRYQKTLITNEKQLQIRHKIENFFENGKNQYLDSEFNLDFLSKQLQVSRLHLSQTFSLNMNTSFNAYLNEKRINFACSELKKNNEISIVVLSEKCGYQSRASFYRNFKLVKGISLAEYKKQLMND